MSYDGNSGEHQPLTPLNTENGRGNHGLKSRKGTKSLKETKPAMELCEIKLDEVMDAELAGRLTATAIEQFLFFMNQVPFPVSRLSRLPVTNEKNQRLRNDFMIAQRKLLQDIKSAISSPQEVSSVGNPLPLRIVITLGSITMPKAAMLFQVPAVRNDPVKSSASPLDKSHSSNVWSDELPPDSDSDEPDDDGEPNPSNPSQAATKPTNGTRPSFTPFHDEDPVDGPTSSTLLASTPVARNALSPHLNGLSQPPRIGHMLDENRTSKARLDKRFRTAERDLTMAISSLDVFTEEMELSKIHVYLQAPRTSEWDGWHPRPSVVKTLDALANFPKIEASAVTKLAKMNAFAVKVSLTHGEATDSLRDDIDTAEYVWLEWDGKLMGVE